MREYHLTKDGNSWKLKPEGGSRAVVSADTKVEAVQQMRDYMQAHPGSVKIHKENGQIQEERTYPRSADPSESKG
jgi:hypothetical protein